MTREEWQGLAIHLKQMYQQNEKFLPDLQMVDRWYAYLKDCRTEYVKIAVRDYISSERFPPTVADIMNRYREIDEKQKERLRDLKDIFDYCHSCYPANLWGEDDWARFKGKIKSERFADALGKADRIKRYILADRITGETPFAEYIEGIEV